MISMILPFSDDHPPWQPYSFPPCPYVSQQGKCQAYNFLNGFPQTLSPIDGRTVSSPDAVQVKKGEEKELHRFVHHPVQTDRVGTYEIAEKSNGII
jgi:hypothetical protein